MTSIPHVYIVNVSGGLTSDEARVRTQARYGPENTLSVFADTIIEDNDLYRFLIQRHVADSADLCARALALPGLRQMDDRKRALAALRRDTMDRAPDLVWLADGRTPFDVWHEGGAITMPNGAVPCSNELKREMIARWLATQNYPYTLVFGMDWSEQHRMDRLVARYAPTPCWFPLAEPPYLDKCHIAARLERDGIAAPRLYGAGFAHNNCGGGCVKAGQAHWAHLWRTDLDTYGFWEGQEAKFGRATILKDRRGGVAVPMSLAEFRRRLERGEAYDRAEWGGCGCFAPVYQEQIDISDVAPRTERPVRTRKAIRAEPVALADQPALEL